MFWTEAVTTRRRGFRPDVDGLEARWVMTTVPAGYVSATIAQGLSYPTSMALAPDGRIFVAQQSGQLRIVQNGVLLPTPLISLNVDFEVERGLVGVALDPNFGVTPWVYVYYTVPKTQTMPAHNRVSRFLAAGNAAVPGSEQVLLELTPLGDPHHNAGALDFGPDGKLYIDVGENDQPSQAQSLNSPLGKILRINSDGTIPTDNPFYNITTGINRAIWATGLRNPFSAAFQPGTGTFFINDVGNDTWEEINLGVAGANYGWPATEGPTSNPQFHGPIFAYKHGPNDRYGSAITGGAFDSAYNSLVSPNSYYFSDYTGDWVHRLDLKTGKVQNFASNLPKHTIGDKVDTTGKLYVLSIGNGKNTGAITVISRRPPVIRGRR